MIGTQVPLKPVTLDAGEHEQHQGRVVEGGNPTIDKEAWGYPRPGILRYHVDMLGREEVRCGGARANKVCNLIMAVAKICPVGRIIPVFGARMVGQYPGAARINAL